jgi:1-acyl-sn-glycerol-3-phosphate acyltransferase
LASQNEDVYFEYCDENYVKSLEINILNHLNTYYFRSRFIGFDENHERNNPDRPLIYIGNHSGMAFPWDAMMLGAGLFKMNNHSFTGTMRPLKCAYVVDVYLDEPVFDTQFLETSRGH